MRAGIDIDGVLTNVEQFILDYISKYCVENNIEYNIEYNIGDSSYNYCKTFNISKEIEIDFWDIYLEKYAKNEKVRPFAAEVIKKLKKEGHEIYIITARWYTNEATKKGNRMKNITKKWLKKNQITYDKLIFSKSENERKNQEIIDYKIDLMIEDSPTNILELSKKIPVICYSAGYNKHCSGNNIIRCYSWYDIYKKINTFHNHNN